MSEQEVMDAIAEARSLQLATLDPEGRPHLSTMWFGLLEGDIVAWTPRDSRKLRNLRGDNRAACLVEAGSQYDDIRGVSMKVDVELVEDPIRLAAIARAIFERNFPPDSQPDVDALVAGGRRVGLVFHRIATSSWDHRKLGTTGPRP